MNARAIQVGAKGRVVLPAPIRHRLGLEEGSELIARVDGASIVLEPRSAAIERLQALVRERRRAGRPSLVDELLAERRAESRRESGRG